MVVLRKTLQTLLVLALLTLAFLDFSASRNAMFSLKEALEKSVFNVSASSSSSRHYSDNYNLVHQQEELVSSRNTAAGDTPVLLASRESPPSSTTPDDKNQPQRRRKLPYGFIQLEQEDPKPWLENLEFGKLLGSGAVSTTVEGRFINQGVEVSINTTKRSNTTTTTTNHEKQQHQYVVKLGAGSDERQKAAVGVEAMSWLSPHPSIPRTFHFAPEVDVIDLFGPLRATENTSTSALSDEEEEDDGDDDTYDYGSYKQFWSGIDDDAKARFYRKGSVSIIVEERKFPTHQHASHFDRNAGAKILIVPPALVRCFFKRLFEVLNHAHKHNVMLRDVSLNNMMLSDGELIFFDWNMAKIYHPDGPPEKVHTPRLTGNGPPENRRGGPGGGVYVNAHAWDVWMIGERIIGIYLTSQTELEQQLANRNTTKSASLLLSRIERNKLEDLKNKMIVFDPAKRPSLGELLTNHTYFVGSGSEQNCTLKW